MMYRKITPTKEELENAYEELKSCKAVSERYNCCGSTIYNLLKLYGIKTIPMKGRELTEEHKKKISQGLPSDISRMKGKHHSEETKAKMSENRKGNKNSNYKGNKTVFIRKMRRTKEYVHWRKAVIERACGKCEICGRNLPLEAHHIRSIHKDISGIYDLENGQALCNDCHLIADGKEKRKYD